MNLRRRSQLHQILAISLPQFLKGAILAVLEDSKMHSAAMWLELAERARSLADGMADPTERSAALAIVSDYEMQARNAGLASTAGSVAFSGAYPSRTW
jgi:hypothetical protein